jgi:hypothetical protein
MAAKMAKIISSEMKENGVNQWQRGENNGESDVKLKRNNEISESGSVKINENESVTIENVAK